LQLTGGFYILPSLNFPAVSFMFFMNRSARAIELRKRLNEIARVQRASSAASHY
jgi:hypothetical protein